MCICVIYMFYGVIYGGKFNVFSLYNIVVFVRYILYLYLNLRDFKLNWNIYLKVGNYFWEISLLINFLVIIYCFWKYFEGVCFKSNV